MPDPPKNFHIVSDAGIAATHPQARYPLLVAPTTERTEKDFNTLRPQLYPVACWSCGDARFDFGTSFVVPKIKEEIENLQTVRDAIKEVIEELQKKRGQEAAQDPVSGKKVCPRLSIFGHADPVGEDQDNKVLSGRRALAIYAMLIREPKIWENLYDSQATGPYIGATKYDKWGVRTIQIMLKELGILKDSPSSGASGTAKDPVDGKMGPHTKSAIEEFQRKKGMAVSGVADKNTREKLFMDYMDNLCGTFKLDKSEDFLAGGADKDLKGDLQGCSEFNPVLKFSKDDEEKYQKAAYKKERDLKNAPNRRVVIFLYWPGIKVDPQEWPCPSVKAGASACEGKKGTPGNFKRFWSDYEQRRECRNEEREFRQTMDTFACRIYQRQAQHSPCEKSLIRFPTDRIAVGVNYPWFNYGSDFGKNPWQQPPQAGQISSTTQPKEWETPGSGGEPIRKNLQHLKGLGIRVVRWFILCDGMSYGTGENAPVWNPVKKYWECADPNDLIEDADQISDDFERLLEIFRSEGMQILPSLIDFHWCFPGRLVLKGTKKEKKNRTVQLWSVKTRFPRLKDVETRIPWEWLIKGGRYDILLNPVKRLAFLNTVLKPLLERSQDSSDTIFAWEIINEPEWIMFETGSSTWKEWKEKQWLFGENPGNNEEKLEDLKEMQYAFLHPSLGRKYLYDKGTEQPWPAEVPSHQIPAETMEAFVREAVDMINGHGFLATVGSATPSFRDGQNKDSGRYLQFWRNCGVNFIQFHDYEKRPNLKAPWDINVALSLSDFVEKDLKACFVGEFPTDWAIINEKLRPVKDEDFEAITREYIKAAWLEGMTLVMPWSFRNKDEATDWPSAETAIHDIWKNPVADYDEAGELLGELTRDARP